MIKQISFQSKIFITNLIFVLIILGLCSAVLYVKNTRELVCKLCTKEIHKIQHDENLICKNLAELFTLSESVLIGDKLEFDEYHRKRLQIDSLLLELKLGYTNLTCPILIDSLSHLIEAKDVYVKRITELASSHGSLDSSLIDLDNKIIKVKTIKRKKRGLAGLLGIKETIQVPYYSNIENTKSEKIKQLKNCLDSLQIQNQLLNNTLHKLLLSFETSKQQLLFEYNIKMIENDRIIFQTFAIVITASIILLVVSFFVLRFDLQKEIKIKFKLKQAISENIDLLEMRKKIILTVSHDIRGPLGNIHNCADLVSETREKKKREIYLDDIRHSCQHVLHLVNNLMDAYRINEAGDLYNDIPFYLNRFLKRISDEFSRKATSKGLILYSEHSGANVTVKGDADKLEQVLANLLTNAIKFTSRGSVNFHSEYLEGKLRIEIRDTGIGMDEETLKRIFAPFERAAQNVNSEGFGLGLFLTKGLIKILKGKMDVESALGKGSVFRLELPLPETDELVEEDKPDHNTATILPKNVLVVDDDPIQLKIAEDMLGRRGISCTTCMNIREVVVALEKSEYDLILTDVQMPDTDGFGLLRLLRNSDIGNSRTIPVAVMTARGDGNSGIYEKEGFAGCIHKPFNIHGLLAFLSTIVSRTQVSVSGDFDFSSLLENTDDYSHMLSLVVMESEKELEEMESADRITDRETMRKIIHRMMPVWEMLGKDNILRDFQRLLHGSDSQNETVHEHAIQIMEWLKILIEETKKELKKYENSDS